jgi:hypothetical protein
MDYLWPIFLSLCLLVGPVIVLRFLFKRSKWSSLSSHPTAYAVGLTSVVWVGLLTVSVNQFSYKYKAVPPPDSSPNISHLDPAAAALEDEVRNLQQGKLAFDVPPKMKQGKQERVEVRIARGITLDVEQLLKQKMHITAQVEDIQVAPFMIVELNDADGSIFRITPLTQDRQSVAGDGYTKWVWIVTPLESGQQTLYLSVGTRFKLPNSNEETRFTPIYEKNISVQVDRMYETKHFLSGNWQWLTVTLIIPLVGFIWHNRKKKRKETELLP